MNEEAVRGLLFDWLDQGSTLAHEYSGDIERSVRGLIAEQTFWATKIGIERWAEDD